MAFGQFYSGYWGDSATAPGIVKSCLQLPSEAVAIAKALVVDSGSSKVNRGNDNATVLAEQLASGSKRQVRAASNGDR